MWQNPYSLSFQDRLFQALPPSSSDYKSATPRGPPLALLPPKIICLSLFIPLNFVPRHIGECLIRLQTLARRQAHLSGCRTL